MSSVDFSGTGGDPKAEARPNAGNAVSYNVIDSQSPPYFVNTSRSMVSSLSWGILVGSVQSAMLGQKKLNFLFQFNDVFF